MKSTNEKISSELPNNLFDLEALRAQAEAEHMAAIDVDEEKTKIVGARLHEITDAMIRCPFRTLDELVIKVRLAEFWNSSLSRVGEQVHSDRPRADNLLISIVRQLEDMAGAETTDCKNKGVAGAAAWGLDLRRGLPKQTGPGLDVLLA